MKSKVQVELHYEQRNIEPFSATLDTGSNPSRMYTNPVTLMEEIGPEGRAAIFEVFYINFRSEFLKEHKFLRGAK